MHVSLKTLHWTSLQHCAVGHSQNTVGLQVYSKQYEEMVSGLQQQHAKCAGSLKRQVAHAEPYVQVCIIAAAPSQYRISGQVTAQACWQNQILCQ